MRFAVFGAGAIGCYFGGRLAQSGQDVVFIARGKHLEAMRRNGLKVESAVGDFFLSPVNATDHASEIGAVDVVLVGVKAWQVPEAAEAMRPLVGDQTVVLPLQNGVEASAQLADLLGKDRVLSGLCGLVAYVVEPGFVRHAASDPFVTFGELNNEVTRRVELLHEAFAGAEGVTATIAADIHAAVWSKFMFITAWSGIGAVSRCSIGTICSQPETRELLRQALTEVYEVALARKVRMAPDSVESCIAMFDQVPATGTASMQRDIMAGRPSELEQQNGAVVRLGREVSVETPLNSYIYRSLIPMERRARGLIEFDLL